MDRERFETILAAYGADPKRWPEAERNKALSFLREEGAALAEAQQIDALLALDAAEVPSEMLTARALAGARRVRFDWRGPAIALAACAVGGVLIGYGASTLAPPADAAEAVLSQVFGSPVADGFDEIGDEG